MKKAKIALIVSLFAVSNFAAADLSYTNFGVGYIDGDFLSVNTDGFELAGSFAFNDSFHALASYEGLDANGTDLDRLMFGVGYHAGLSSTMDLVTTVSLQDIDIGIFSLDGIQVTGGIRGMPSNSFEYEANLVFEDIDDFDDDTGYEIGARYFPSRDFSVGITARDVNELETIRIDIRFDY